MFPGPDDRADDSSLLPFQLKCCISRDWVLLAISSVLSWEVFKTSVDNTDLDSLFLGLGRTLLVQPPGLRSSVSILRIASAGPGALHNPGLRSSEVPALQNRLKQAAFPPHDITSDLGIILYSLFSCLT